MNRFRRIRRQLRDSLKLRGRFVILMKGFMQQPTRKQERVQGFCFTRLLMKEVAVHQNRMLRISLRLKKTAGPEFSVQVMGILL